MRSARAIYVLAIVGSALAQASGSTPTATNSASSQSASNTVAGSTTSSSGTAKATGTANASQLKATLSATGAANAAIPTGLSSPCQTYMNTLDTDPQFASCTQPLLTATEAFAPTANNSTLSKQTLINTLNTLCTSPGCDSTYLRTQLVDFYNACANDLSGDNPNQALKDTYDILFIMEPLQGALCTKDTDGTYCVLEAPSNTTAPPSTSSAALPNVANNYVVGSDVETVTDAITTFVQSGLVTTAGPSPAPVARRDEQSVIQYAPDTQTFRDTNAAYLYVLPSLSAASLCTPCTQGVLAVYAKWESSTSYGLGLINSPMLGNQAELWQAVASKCGAAFTSEIQGQVGPVVQGLGGALAGGSPTTAGFSIQGGALALVLSTVGAMLAL